MTEVMTDGSPLQVLRPPRVLEELSSEIREAAPSGLNKIGRAHV